VIERLKSEGVYYLFQVGPEGPEYALAELEDGPYLYAFTDEAKARAVAERFDAEVGYFPTPADLFFGLPPETRGLVVDFDPETGEAYRVAREAL